MTAIDTLDRYVYPPIYLPTYLPYSSPIYLPTYLPIHRGEVGVLNTLAKPPPSAMDVFGAVMVMMGGINPSVVVQQNGKVGR